MEPRVLQHDVNGSGEAVVLVPGGLTGWLSWIPHQERLAERYRVIRVQPIHNELGSAGQPGDPDYSAEVEREALRLTIEYLGLDRPHFAGWSSGGRALLEFVVEYPGDVRSLALVEPAAYWVLEQLGQETTDIERADEFVHGLFGREVTEDDLARFLQMAGFVSPGGDPRSDPNWERWVQHRMALSWQGEKLDHPDRSLEDLARITCPVVLFKGTISDEWDRKLVDALADLLTKASVVELEGDHAAHIQSMDAFLEAFERHLQATGNPHGATE
jgi:pimeloyl-ACP methyl ester carboxylesterase